jgi:hypothetical protein
MTVRDTYVCQTCSEIDAEIVDSHGESIPLCQKCIANGQMTTFDYTAPIDLTNRGDVIRWLVNNDPNGCYGDVEVREELLDEPLTLEQAVKFYRHFMYGEDPN